MKKPLLYPMPRDFRYTAGRFDLTKLDDPEIIIGCEDIPSQGYRLTADPDKVTIRAADEAGSFYAGKTIKQLKRSWQRLQSAECFEITDYPEVLERGIMLETLSAAILKFDKLKEFVDLMADFKLNVLALYLENTFAFRNHETVWRDASPYTHSQILELDAYCKERFIELVPYQETFGHMHQWLKHPQYRVMAEVPEGWGHTFSVTPQPFTLCPTDLRSIEFLDELYREIHEVFSSTKICVGCDETEDLGKGRSKELCDKIGKEYVYVDFVNQINERVQAIGCEAQIFGDVVVKYPEALKKLHPDVVIAHWGYEADFPFDEHCSLFREQGREFYLLPSTSSYHSFIGRTDRGKYNLINAVENAVKHRARGVINTQWNYRYNLTTLFDLPWFVYGAGICWRLEENRSETLLCQALDEFVFDDRSQSLAEFLVELGRVFNPIASVPNMFNPVYLSYCNCEKGKAHPSCVTDPEKLRLVLDNVRTMAEKLGSFQVQNPRWEVWSRGLEFGINMFLACGDILLALMLDAKAQTYSQLPEAVKKDFARRFSELRGIYEKLWHLDNRPGGIQLTLEWYDKILNELK